MIPPPADTLYLRLKAPAREKQGSTLWSGAKAGTQFPATPVEGIACLTFEEDAARSIPVVLCQGTMGPSC